MSSAPSHVTETIQDRKKAKELAEARQSGTVAPAVDVKTGHMINPHNPDFITKRPWYLGGEDGPSLEHQADPVGKELLLSLASADQVLKEERTQRKALEKKGQFEVGMWVEALKQNKGAYRICQVLKISKKGTQFDLKYEDGTMESKVVFKQSAKKSMFKSKPRIKMTKSGARSSLVDANKHGKETYDSKRDKYHGYDQDSHSKRVQRLFDEREAIRKQLRDKETAKNNATLTEDGAPANPNQKDQADKGSDSDSDSDVGSDDDSDDEFVQKDEDDKVITSRLARQGGVGGAQMKVTARNLRIREDTAKYLRNLDPSSAYYDPKSRSMRDNPNPEVLGEESQFAGDNFARISGDAIQLAETHLFAWDAVDKGADTMHPQANPSQVELLKKKFQTKSAQLELSKKKKVLDKYGGQEYLDGSGGLANAVERNPSSTNNNNNTAAEERKIRFGVSTIREEYSRDGRMLKGPARLKQVALKSKYQEDIFINGHTTVWGSYFQFGAFSWGYKDDHSLIKNTYCTGANGRKANDEANAMRYGTGVAGSAALAQARGMLKALPKNANSNSNNNKMEPPSSRSRLYGEADPNAEMDSEKLKQALEKDKEQQRQKPPKDGKRKYNSMNLEVDVTQEEMEAYRLRKGRSDDPMAKFSKSDEVLDYK